MKLEEAKAILCVWRPDGSDHADPAFREALELARKDPQLLAWLHDQQEFDSTMAANLRAIRAPAEGRAEILAHGNMVLKHRTARRRVRVWTLAAVLAVAVAGWWRFSALMEPVLPSRSFTLAGAAEHLSVNHKSMEFYSDDVGELQEWLERRKNPVPARLPGRLSTLRGYGSQDWRTSWGRISLICFYPEADRSDYGSYDDYNDETEWLHFFVFPENFADLPDATPTPRFVEGNDWVFVVWREGEKAFAVGLPARSGARERLQGLIGV